jgi:hypothetical protein
VITSDFAASTPESVVASRLKRSLPPPPVAVQNVVAEPAREHVVARVAT